MWPARSAYEVRSAVRSLMREAKATPSASRRSLPCTHTTVSRGIHIFCGVANAKRLADGHPSSRCDSVPTRQWQAIRRETRGRRPGILGGEARAGVRWNMSLLSGMGLTIGLLQTRAIPHIAHSSGTSHDESCMHASAALPPAPFFGGPLFAGQVGGPGSAMPNRAKTR